jgi:hypothetical protein
MQSAAYELQRQYYNSIGLGRASSALPDLNLPPAPGITASLHNLYTRFQLLISGHAASFHATLGTWIAAYPENNDAVRARYCTIFAPVVRRWSLLSSNTRTIGIFLCALLGVPLLYFLLEAFLFTAVLVALLADQNRRYQAFTATLI